MGAQAFDDLGEIAIKDGRQVVAGKPDAVVSQSILREVVGADLLRTIAAADLAAPVVALGVSCFSSSISYRRERNSFMAMALFLCWLFSCWQ